MKGFGPAGITKARRRASSAAATCGWKALRSIAALTRRTVSGRTPGRLCRTRSTVARLTPASRAMSFSVSAVAVRVSAMAEGYRGVLRYATHFEAHDDVFGSGSHRAASAAHKVARQEQAVGILDIALERAAEHKTVRLVERMRGLEIIPGAGLEAEPLRATRAGLSDDVAEHL